MRCLSPESATHWSTAQRLGEQAVALGMEPLDVARIHERAIAAITARDDSAATDSQTRERARRFFAEALTPIEKTHRAAREADAQAEALTQSLRVSAREATETARRLKHGAARRRTAEAALKNSEQRRAERLAEAERLQEDLRKMAHRFLTAQEAERKKTGRLLQDEIAQALLSIHIRLLALKKAARANTGMLKKEIAATQRMVKHSGQTIHRLAHTLDDDHET